MFHHNVFRAIGVSASLFGAVFLLATVSPHQVPSDANCLQVVSALAAWHPAGKVATEQLTRPDSKAAPITVDYPQDGSIFPPEILSPTFIWRDPDTSSSSWRIDIVFADGAKPVHTSSLGEHMQIGEIDPRCISPNESASFTDSGAGRRAHLETGRGDLDIHQAPLSEAPSHGDNHRP